jgi:integrase
VRSGINPITQRRQARSRANAGPSFVEIARAYIAAHEPAWRHARHAQQWQNTLRDYVLPTLGEVPVGAVDVGEVMQVLEPLWRRTPVTASRVRARIEAVLDYAKARGWRSGENPARWRGHLDQLLPRPRKLRPVQHYRALLWREIGTFMHELAAQDSMAAQTLGFLILTAARTNEVIGARWTDIDLEHAVWIVPAGRMKGGREHRVPLSAAARAVLDVVAPFQRADGFVFPGMKAGKPISADGMLKVLARMGHSDLTVHGFRSTFRDWAAEATSYPNHVVEQALAHTIGSAVEAAYRRGDLFEKRSRLMADWAEHCGRVLPAAGEVVALRAAV